MLSQKWEATAELEISAFLGIWQHTISASLRDRCNLRSWIASKIAIFSFAEHDNRFSFMPNHSRRAHELLRT